MTPGAEPEAIRVLEHEPRSGAWNMAVDHALMDPAREGSLVLRLYGWDPPCLSFGRNQEARGRYRGREARRRSIDLVRRPTGGRAVYHRREVTYAVTAPADLWGGLRRSYSRINRALLRGLAELGVPARAAGERGRGAPGPGARACFRDPLPGEVVAGEGKLVGSAQWRDGGALLQHGSVLLRDEQAVVDELRRDGGSPAGTSPAGNRPAGDGPAGDRSGGGGAAREGPAEGAAVDPVEGAALADFLDPLPSRDHVASALAEGFRAELGLELRRSELAAGERRRADGLAARYRDDEWTWRR